MKKCIILILLCILLGVSVRAYENEMLKIKPVDSVKDFQLMTQVKFDTQRFDNLFRKGTKPDFLKMRQGSIVIKVGKVGGVGTIVCVDEDYLYVLTAKHVIKRRGKIAVEVIDINGNATIIRNISKKNISFHKTVDLGLLKVPNPGGRFGVMRLAKTPALIGDEIYTIGHPCNIFYAVNKGIVSSYIKKTFSNIKEEYMVISAPSFSGNSGGAIVNKRNELVGVVVGIQYIGNNINDYKNTVYVFHIAYAVKLQFIKELLSEQGLVFIQ